MTALAKTTGAASKFPPNPHRRSLIAKLHIAKAQLSMADDDYREVLFRHCGVWSARDASEAGMIAALKEFEGKGFSARPKMPHGKSGPGRGKLADHPTARKARAMWISLYQLGVVRNPQESSLEGFACRQLKCAAFQWGDQSQGYLLIEALKAMAERAGWSQRTDYCAGPGAAALALKRSLMRAILARLVAEGIAPPEWDVATALMRLCGHESRMLETTGNIEDFERASKLLGRVLREHAQNQTMEA